MKVLIDTCVVIDALQNRYPHCETAKQIFLLLASGTFEGFLTSKSICDINYIIRKYTHNEEETRKIIENITELFSILDTKEDEVRKALLSEISDYEDAIMCETALTNEIDYIITRNTKDFSNSPVSTLLPNDFLTLF